MSTDSIINQEMTTSSSTRMTSNTEGNAATAAVSPQAPGLEVVEQGGRGTTLVLRHRERHSTRHDALPNSRQDYRPDNDQLKMHEQNKRRRRQRLSPAPASFRLPPSSPNSFCQEIRPHTWLSPSTLPTEVLGLIESYLYPSDCAHLSGTCMSFKQRWTTTRWRLTFHLRYGNKAKNQNKNNHGGKTCTITREASFVGCCCEEDGGCCCCCCCSSGGTQTTTSSSNTSSLENAQNQQQQQQQQQHENTPAKSCCRADCPQKYTKTCPHTNANTNANTNTNSCSPGEDTKFNVSALIPSVRKAYATLYDTIELAMLGYYDAHYNRFVVAARELGDLVANNGENNNDNPINNNNNDNNNEAPHAQEEPFHQDNPTRPNSFPIPAAESPALSDFMDYCLFLIGLKPLFRRPKKGKRNGSSRGNNIGRRFDPLLAVRSSTTSMSAWKLACILRERGVDCIRCSICDQFDLGGSNVPYNTWMRPCNCPELVHRRCLERRLGMITSLCWSSLVGGPHAQRMYITYDDSNHDHHRRNHHPHHHQQHPQNQNQNQNHGPRHLNGVNYGVSTLAAVHEETYELLNPKARCDTCGTQYRRTVRLPCSKAEVVMASLTDKLSLLRALSTFVHFLLACIFISATEGMCKDHPHSAGHTPAGVSCLEEGQYYFLLDGPLPLKWPSRGGLALMWWQLQQCCMLHIFFSSRFAAIVDRLWTGPIRHFYCRLYLYFLSTSAGLAVSYIPFVRRSVRRTVLSTMALTITILPLGGGGGGNANAYKLLHGLEPVLELLALVNLMQYAVVSTMVVCIFWRTNLRIFTVADRRSGSEMEGERRGGGEWETRRDSHPIFHGQWE